MTQQTIQPAGTLSERVVDYVGYSSAAMEKMAAELAAVEGQHEKCAALIPRVVDALVSGERITEDQREKAAQVLADPVQALEMLLKVAVHRNAGEQSLGTPVDGQTKQASAGYNSLTNPNVGARTSAVKESDNRLFQGLGLNTPTGE